MKREQIKDLNNGNEILEFIHKEYEVHDIDIFNLENEIEEYYIIATNSENISYDIDDMEGLIKLNNTIMDLDKDMDYTESTDHWIVTCYIWGSLGWLIFKEKKAL